MSFNLNELILPRFWSRLMRDNRELGEMPELSPQL